MPERAPPVAAIHRPGLLTRGLLALLAGLVLAVAGGALAAVAQAATIAQQLGSLPTIQPFNGEATSRSQFSTRWSGFSFALEKGRDITEANGTGWSSSNAFPNLNGAYYSATSYSAASGGAAAAVTLSVNPEARGRWFSLWLDARNEARASGYELRFNWTTEETYTVELIKWVRGAQTVLASQPNVTLIEGNSFGIVDEGSTVSGWTDLGAGFTQVVSASDSTYSSGNVGLSSNSNFTFLRTFKAGQLTPTAPVLTRTNPASPADNNSPLVIGTAVSGTTVKLYTNATCTGEPVATGTAAALASPGLSVSVAENATTRIYATATDELRNVSECSTGLTYTEDSTIGIATGLARLTLLDAFATPESPLSGGGRWSRLSWASNTGLVESGGTLGGWGPSNGYPVVSGAYWNSATFTDAGPGVAVAGTLSVGAELANRWFSLWLDMSEPGSAQSGYELRFTYVGVEEEEDLYDVTLSKWVSGTRTTLATSRRFTLAAQSSFALVDKGGTVYAWTDAGGGYRQLLRATDTAFSRGYAGIEGAGNITRVRQFKAGTL